jgi:hypothetical protein
MNYTNKKFTNLTNGKVYEVIDQFEDIAILNDRSKVKVNRLLDKSYFDEYIDPSSFFKNESLLSTFADKIRNMPQESVSRASNEPRNVEIKDYNSGRTTTSSVNESFNNPSDLIQMDNTQSNLDSVLKYGGDIKGSTVVRPVFNESAVIMSDPEEERMEMLRKAQSIYGNATMDSSAAMQNQYESIRGYIEDDNPNRPVIQPFRPQQPQQPQPQPQQQFNQQEEVIRIDADRKEEDEEVIQRVEVNRDDIGEVIVNNQPQELVYKQVIVPPVVDPIVQMFQNVKRNTKFSIQLTIEEKIPRVDFIEMMEDSYNQSIIDYLAKEFTDNLLKNPDVIRNMIKDKINSMVYPDGKAVDENIYVEPSKVKPIKKTRVKKTETKND